MSAVVKTYHLGIDGASKSFFPAGKAVVGHVPTIAITPVADGGKSELIMCGGDTQRLLEKARELLRQAACELAETPPPVSTAPYNGHVVQTGALAHGHQARPTVTAGGQDNLLLADEEHQGRSGADIGVQEGGDAAGGVEGYREPGPASVNAPAVIRIHSAPFADDMLRPGQWRDVSDPCLLAA